MTKKMIRQSMRFYLRRSLSRKRNWKQQVDTLIRKGLLDEAEAHLEKILRYQNDNLAALTRMAQISERRNDWAVTAARWERVIEISLVKPEPTLARKKLKEAYIKWGDVHVTAGRKDDAQACYQKAWSLDVGIIATKTHLSDDDYLQLATYLMKTKKIDEFIEAMISERTLIDAEYLKKYDLIKKEIKAADQRDKVKNTIRALFLAHKIDELTFDHMFDVSKFRFPVAQASSFRVNMIRRRRMKQLGVVPDRWLTSSKAAGYAFAQRLEVKSPAMIGVAKFADLPKKDGIAIKPQNSSESRGVYLIISKSNIRSVHRYKDLYCWEELEQSVQEDLSNGTITNDEFRIEEYVCDDLEKKTPARDLKFYTFYGEVGLVLEVSRYPTRENWWWSAERKAVQTGKYEQARNTGYGVTQEQITLAAQISLEIPAPFMRIDFLRGHDQILFTGFCSTPGGFQDFNKETDEYLGDLYLKAEIRLQNDLLNGKEFEHLLKFNKEWATKIRGAKIS